jgi:hypothetical protein
MAPNKRAQRKQHCDDDGVQNNALHFQAFKALFHGPKLRYCNGCFSHDEKGRLNTHIKVTLNNLYLLQFRHLMPDSEKMIALVHEGTEAAGPILQYVKSSSVLKSLTLCV